MSGREASLLFCTGTARPPKPSTRYGTIYTSHLPCASALRGRGEEKPARRAAAASIPSSAGRGGPGLSSGGVNNASPKIRSSPELGKDFSPSSWRCPRHPPAGTAEGAARRAHTAHAAAPRLTGLYPAGSPRLREAPLRGSRGWGSRGGGSRPALAHRGSPPAAYRSRDVPGCRSPAAASSAGGHLRP